jgi:hypothetical protein
MNYFLRILISLILSICLYNCSSSNSTPPEFVDGGKTIDSLKNAYNCQGIEYENWEDDDATDSSLTVCFINSNKIPTGNPDESYEQLKGIATKAHSAGTDIRAKDL